MGLISSIRAALSGRAAGTGAPPATSPVTSGPAPALAGVAPDGSALEVAPATEPAGVDLLFITSDCRECRGCWSAAGAPGVVIVTPDPATESSRAVAGLAPPAATVVMSSAAWHAYGVTKAPWKVEVRGGEVVSAGPAV